MCVCLESRSAGPSSELESTEGPSHMKARGLGSEPLTSQFLGEATLRAGRCSAIPRKATGDGCFSQ